MQIKAAVKKNRTRGNRGVRLLTSSLMAQRTSAPNNTQLVIWMLSDVVPPYAHGA
jgi:hypothetical protein